jgi:hypothetical protein
MDKIKPTISAIWLAVSGITLAQFNAVLGLISLSVGILYQLWKWNKEYKSK